MTNAETIKAQLDILREIDAEITKKQQAAIINRSREALARAGGYAGALRVIGAAIQRKEKELRDANTPAQ